LSFGTIASFHWTRRLYASTASNQPKGFPGGLIFQGCYWLWWWNKKSIPHIPIF